MAVGLSIACGALFAVIAGGEPPLPFPWIARPTFWLGWGPLAALSILAFLALGGTPPDRRRFLIGGATTAALIGLVAGLVAAGASDDGVALIALHLPFLAWAAIAGAVTLGRADRDRHVYAHAVQSLETLVAAGIFVASGGIFTGLTLGLLAVFGIEIPEEMLRVPAAFGIGVIPVLAVAATYDPRLAPAAQPGSGVARLLRIMTWLALPAAAVVLAIYVFWLIPTNFGRAFAEREVLAVYNVTIIAVIAAVTAAAAVASRDREWEGERYLRPLVVTIIGLTALLNLYALAANLSRILEMGLTTNRHAVLGWNVVTLAMLGFLLWRSWAAAHGEWLPELRTSIGRALVLPVAWALWVVAVVPLL